MEASGEEEYRTERIGGDGQTVLHQLHVFKDLTANEEGTHDVGQGHPLIHAPAAQVPDATNASRLVALSCGDTELAGHRGHHQDEGVDGCESEVEGVSSLCP